MRMIETSLIDEANLDLFLEVFNFWCEMEQNSIFAVYLIVWSSNCLEERECKGGVVFFECDYFWACSGLPANTIVGPKDIRLSLESIFDKDSNSKQVFVTVELELFIIPKYSIQSSVATIPEGLEK